MTNEQYIQVVEKVWGWDLNSWSDYSDCLTVEQEVNSWAGFGRTMESIAKREILFKTLPNILSIYLAGNSTVKWLFETIHLSVLEESNDTK